MILYSLTSAELGGFEMRLVRQSRRSKSWFSFKASRVHFEVAVSNSGVIVLEASGRRSLNLCHFVS